MNLYKKWVIGKFFCEKFTFFFWLRWHLPGYKNGPDSSMKSPMKKLSSH